MKRRDFLSALGTTAAGITLAGTHAGVFAQATAAKPARDKYLPEQIPLPYKPDELAPLFSELQINTHYGKHHAAYFNTLKELTDGKPEAQMDLETLVIKAREQGGALFNNAAQLWNHNFFWDCLAPQDGKPEGGLLKAIERDFGGFDKFSEQFCATSAKQFGSGWGWLVKDAKDGKLSILTTSNAENPLGTGKIPLLTADVWEHTYYIDYLNRRADYLKAFMDKIHWGFVASQFAKTV
ncbi:MAG: superoxide dismutase [Planctomycetaceae bacterium]|nr:superoxide dismutase [Planctomycetaceae bacterium]